MNNSEYLDKTTSFKIKALCFHGYSQNKDIFYHSLSSLRKKYKSKIEFAVINAPHTITGGEPDMKCWWNYKISENESKDQEENSDDQTPKHIVWNDLCINNISDFVGYEDSKQAIIKHLLLNEYELFIGFSQGAAFLSLLCMEGIINKKCIFYCGFYPLINLPSIKLNIPSIHVFGEKDTIIPNHMSNRLSNIFENPLCISHKGRHVVQRINLCL